MKDCEDFYENKHKNSDLFSVNFTSLSENKFYKILKKANIELIRDYYNKHKNRVVEEAKFFYDNRDVSFRGFRQV